MQDNQDIVSLEADDITITAGSELVDNTAQGFLWGYYLCIENNSNEKITLVGKDWNITDALGNNFSDDSVGFEGAIPELEPGEFFEFTGSAPLKSSNAIFYGSCKILKKGNNIAQNIKMPILQFNAKDISKAIPN